LLNVISGLLNGAGAPASTNSYESIATFTGSGNPSSVTFSSIPSTFKHLQIRWLSRNSIAAPDDVISVQFNGDTASNYDLHFMYGDGSSAGAIALTNRAEIYSGYQTSNSAGANIYGAGIIDVLDYQNSNKYKTLRTLGGDDRNGAGTLYFGSGLWRSTSAITSVKLFSTGTFATNSSFALYGIKG
jgi:hypothetical protein